jgi:hypothetical protein
MFERIDNFKLKNEYKKKILLHCPSFDRKFLIYTSQWKKVCRKDVEILINFKNYEQFKCIDDILQSTEAFPKLLQSSARKDNLKTALFAPDEWQIGLVLRQYYNDKNYGITKHQSTCSTYCCFQKVENHSPITFTSLTKKYSMTICEDLKTQVTNTQPMCLLQNIAGCQALIQQKLQPNLITFRKVEISEEIWRETNMPWLPITTSYNIQFKPDTNFSKQHNNNVSRAGHLKKGDEHFSGKIKRKANNAGLEVMNATKKKKNYNVTVNQSKEKRRKKNKKGSGFF